MFLNLSDLLYLVKKKRGIGHAVDPTEYSGSFPISIYLTCMHTKDISWHAKNNPNCKIRHVQYIYICSYCLYLIVLYLIVDCSNSVFNYSNCIIGLSHCMYIYILYHCIYIYIYNANNTIWIVKKSCLSNQQ